MPSIQLPVDRNAPSTARRFVAHNLRNWGISPAIVDDCELLASELVTNAVVHARSTSTLRIERRDDHVWVAVEDNSPTPACIRDDAILAVAGRGLVLVERIARRWGSDGIGAGKVVWFELALEPASLR